MTATTTQIEISRDDLFEVLAEGLDSSNFQDLLICVDADGNIACVNTSEMNLVHNQRWVARMDLQRFAMQQDEDGNYPGDKNFSGSNFSGWYVYEPGLTVDEMFGSSMVFLADGSDADLALVD